MRPFLRENGLSLFFAGLFAATLVGQSFAGQHQYNADQIAHEDPSASWWEYVRSTHFWGSVMENWQSEFLQFTLFIAATIWLLQKGSNESKELDQAGLESDARQRVGRHVRRDSPWAARVGGLWTRVYENSLLLVMGSIFLVTWAMQSLNNWRGFNEEQLAHEEATVSWGSYLRPGRLLGADARELAVRVPRRRVDRRVLGLPATAGLARVQAGRRAPRRDRLVRLRDEQRTTQEGVKRAPGEGARFVQRLLRGVGVRQWSDR